MFLNVQNSSFMSWQLEKKLFETPDDRLKVDNRETRILRNVAKLSDDGDNTKIKIFSIIEHCSPGERRRFFNWLEFLQEQSFLHNRLYNQFLRTFLWMFSEKNYLNLQTQQQFEAAKVYLEWIFTTDLHINVEDRCKEIFLCICILVRRPDFQLRPFPAVFSILTDLQPDHGVPVFDHLFEDHSRPLFFKRHLLDCTYRELQALENLLEGKSPRKILKPLISVSKTENALLHAPNLPELEKGMDNILPRYLCMIRLLKEAPSEGNLLQSILEVCHSFRENFDSFRADLAFWASVFRLLVNSPLSFEDINEIRSVLDYFHYQRYGREEPEDYSFKGRNFHSIMREVEEWHGLMTWYHYSDKDMKTTWKPLEAEEYSLVLDREVYKISEITNGKRLWEESKVLKHCVYSYLNRCVQGKTHIFSLTHEKAGQSIPKITIEVENNQMVQERGKANSDPDKKYYPLIREWCELNLFDFPAFYLKVF